MSAATAQGQTLTEFEMPLREVTFVVVDVETTGGSPETSEITEVAAVKIRGGETLGTFHALVNPGTVIPSDIAVLTGITDAMVVGAPPIEAVLPAFLEFSRATVLVAHNAPFDLGFLRVACDRIGVMWPGFESVDTARLARNVLTREEAPDCKLATLARLFCTATSPCHRALADAEATVDVLQGLLDRLGDRGAQSLGELRRLSVAATPGQRRDGRPAEAAATPLGRRRRTGRVAYVDTLRTLVRQLLRGRHPRARPPGAGRLALRCLERRGGRC